MVCQQLPTPFSINSDLISMLGSSPWAFRPGLASDSFLFQGQPQTLPSSLACRTQTFLPWAIPLSAKPFQSQHRGFWTFSKNICLIQESASPWKRMTEGMKCVTAYFWVRFGLTGELDCCLVPAAVTWRHLWRETVTSHSSAEFTFSCPADLWILNMTAATSKTTWFFKI